MNRKKIDPDHYMTSTGAEVIDITETLNFNRGNVVKYVARAGFKAGESTMDDLLKARWYLNREIDRVERARESRWVSVETYRQLD